MKKWQIEIKGDTWDLENLSNNHQSPDWSIIKIAEGDKDVYYLESSRFYELNNSKDVEKAARELILEINGVAKTEFPDYKQIELHGVALLDENGQLNKFIHIKDSIHGRTKLYPPTIIQGDGTVEESKMPNRLKLISILAKTDENVRRALILFGKPKLSWNDLYGIYDIIKDNVELEEVKKTVNISSNQIKLFRRTCLRWEAVGDEARHPSQKFDPPKNPMKYEDAVTLITKLYNAWITKKKNEIPGRGPE